MNEVFLFWVFVLFPYSSSRCVVKEERANVCLLPVCWVEESEDEDDILVSLFAFCLTFLTRPRGV